MTHSSSPSIQRAQERGVTYLTIDNQSKRNALTLQMWESLPALLREAEEDASCRVVVLQGAGSHAFAAGSDISQFEQQRSTPVGVALYNATYSRAIEQLQNVKKPVIARIKGYCMGAGVALAMYCDLRYASDNATFSIPAAKLGLGYQHLWLQRLSKLVGPAKAKEILFTADHYDAQAAQDMGLVNGISTDAEFASLIERIGSLTPLTITASKIAIDQASHPDHYDHDVCHRAVQECFESQDYREGQRAFKEKRQPSFKGL